MICEYRIFSRNKVLTDFQRMIQASVKSQCSDCWMCICWKRI